MDSFQSPQDGPLLRALLAEKEARLEEERRARQQLEAELRALQDEAARLTLLNELSQKIGLAESEAAFYRTAAHYATRIFPIIERASVALLSPDGCSLSLFTIEGNAASLPAGTTLPFEGTVVGLTARERRAVVVAGDEFEKTELLDWVRLRGAGLRATMTAPLISGGRVIGTLNTGSSRPDAFSAEDAELLLKLSTLLAAHVERWRLLTELRASLEETRKHERELQRELDERAAAERERAALREQIIEAQQRRLKEVSAPMIPITDAIMVMPLIGIMDAARAEHALESVLNGARERGAEIVIIDITGMQQVGSYAAGSLIKTANALRLLGVQTVVTGVRPEVAKTLVQLGIDMGALTTRGTLKDAIAYAFESTRARGSGSSTST